MSFRFKEVKEVSNQEKKTVNQATDYKYTTGEMPSEDDRKKLERSNFSYKPTEEVSTIGNQENIRGKLR